MTADRGRRERPFAYEPAERAADPQVSLVTQVSSARPEGLRGTASSVLGQSFQAWEWVIVDAESKHGEHAEVAAVAASDPRISVVRSDPVLRGEFVVELRCGTELEPAALERALWFSASHPGASGAGSLTIRRRPRALHPDPTLDAAPFANRLAKTKRRLLLVVPFVTPGGADKFNLDLVEQLIARDWEITVVTTLYHDHSWLPRLEALTPDVFPLPQLLAAADYPRCLRYLVESRRPDAVLISNSMFAYTALPYLRRLAGGIPVADYLHSEHPDWLDGGYPRLSVDRRSSLDLSITASAHLKEWMVERGGEPERIEVCYIGVDQQVTKPKTRPELGLPEDRPILLYACRIDADKQPGVFAKTVLELRRQGYRFSALAVGDGPYRSWLEKFVRRHRLDDCVRFLGDQPNTRVRELMAVADCVFLPSKVEGISAVLYEALAEGVAVVAADIGGQRELVTPECGLLVPAGDEEGEVTRYTAALRELLDDPGRRRSLGHAGRERVRSLFTLSRMGDRMDALLERAREVAQARPKAAVDEEGARRAAHEAIQVASWPSPDPSSSGSLSWRFRLRLLRIAAAVGMPVYHLALRLGLHRVEGLRRRVAQALEPKPGG